MKSTNVFFHELETSSKTTGTVMRKAQAVMRKDYDRYCYEKNSGCSPTRKAVSMDDQYMILQEKKNRYYSTSNIA